jgi:hypothetical protein
VNLMHLIQVYERASGQKINNSKTAIFFSNNTRMKFRDFICSSMGIAQTACYEIYLGLPALVGRSKPYTFSSIIHRVRKRLDGWKEKFIS